MILILRQVFAFAVALLLTVAATVQAQRAPGRSPADVLRRVEELISGVNCGNDVVKHTRTDAVAVLVASGRDLLPTLTEKVAAGSEAPVFIEAIGFLASENDKEALAALAHAAFTSSIPERPIGSQEAVDSLLRIGGVAIVPVREFLEKTPMTPIQYEVFFLRKLWQVRRLDDLEGFKRSLEKVISTTDEPTVKVTCQDGIARIEAVAAILREPDSAASEASLFAILTMHHHAFSSVPGPIPGYWALERIVMSRFPDAVTKLRESLGESGVYANEHFRASVVSAIEELESNSSGSEKEIAAANSHGRPRYFELEMVGAGSDDLLRGREKLISSVLGREK